jgi:hypothetical protein
MKWKVEFNDGRVEYYLLKKKYGISFGIMESLLYLYIIKEK